MPSKALSEKKLGSDSILETEHLDDHGTADGLAVEGCPVNLYGVHSDNENSYNRRFGGQAFLDFGGNIGCVHS
ncbi:MAG: hypothetical protein WAV98_00250 [Minisyncoccia bacterium]